MVRFRMSASPSRSASGEAVDRRHVPLGQHHGLERPDRPERHHRQETLVLFHHALAAGLLQPGVLAQQAGPRAPRHASCAAVSLATSLGIAWFDQIWQCGCGLLAPIMAPRFSKICTWRISGMAPSSANWSAQTSTTRRRSAGSMLAMVRLWRGEKQTTRQSPGSGSTISSPSCSKRVERRIGLERREIVIENEGRSVGGIAHAAGARVAGTEIALRVVLGLPRGGGFLPPAPARAGRCGAETPAPIRASED